MSKATIQEVNVESLFTELQETGKARLSDHATPVTEETETPVTEESEPATEEEQPTESAQEQPALRLLDYSEKAFAVVGDTKAHRKQLKQLGGRFNRNLRCGAGWIFSKKKAKEVATALGFTA